jgi:outer membrane protein assembly factor BamB
MELRNTLSGLIAILAMNQMLFAAVNEWPQWRGPNRDGVSPDTNLQSSWPQDGPALAWKAAGLGKGFASVVIAGGRIFTTGDRDDAQKIIALDAATHQVVWTAPMGKADGDGSRGTPTVDGELVYAISRHGDLVCVEAATGKERWRKNFGRDFGGQMMSGWGYSESPLVDGDKLVCTPGGKDAMMVALNKKTGEVIWKCTMPDIGTRGKDGAGYSSIVAADVSGIRQYVQIVGRGAIGVAATDGRFLWGYNRVANDVANIPTPLVLGDHVFCSTGYKTGSALVKLMLTEDGKGIKAQEVYFLGPDTLENHHGGVVRVGDYLYAGHGTNAGKPVCLEIKSGKVKWSEPAIGGGSAAVVYADKHIYFRYDDGTVALVEATPEKFILTGKFKVSTEKGPKWAHPVVLGGKLYLRDNDTLLCYDVNAGAQSIN